MPKLILHSTRGYGKQRIAEQIQTYLAYTEYKSNSINSIGVEDFSRERDRYRKYRERLKKERENCLHGQILFPIHFNIKPLYCEQCKNESVYISSTHVWCLMCDWNREIRR